MIKGNAWETCINIAICTAFISGVMLIESKSIEVLVRRRRLRHRLSPGPQEGKISSYCSGVLSAAFGKAIDGFWLIAAEIILFIAGFIASFKKLNLFMSVFMGFLASLIPVAVLFVQINSNRSKGSREAVSVVSELYRQYRICGLNIFEAIEKTIDSEADYPVCKKQLYLLLLRIREASGLKDIKEGCGNFAFSLGTVWAKMLANSIEIAAKSGTDISLALADMIGQLQEAQSRMEAKKRLNSEAVRMTVFLVPLLYWGTVLASVKYLGFSFRHFLRNQFLTGGGIVFITVNTFLFVLNLLILSAVNNERVDL